MPMRAERWRRLGGVLGLALLALVAWRMLQFRDQLQLDVRVLRSPWLAAAVCAALASQAAFATAWHRLLGSGGAGAWRHDAACWSVSLAGKYVPGKVLQPVLRVGAYRGRASAVRVASAMLRELLLAMGASCTWVAAHAALDARAPAAWGWAAVAGAVLLPLAAWPPCWSWLEQLAARLARRAPASSPAAQVHAQAQAQAGGHAAQAWAWQVLAYLLLGVSVDGLARALVPGQAPGLLAATGAFGFAGIAGVLAFVVPAGLGVREAALAWYLAAWLPAGPAALLALAARACLTLAEGVAVAWGLWQLRAGRAPPPPASNG
jgi:hypothetical protein